ncbi:hypothetical protein AAG906_040553 [Vitis piasezkii]
MEMEANSWDSWLIRSLRPIHLPNPLPTPRDFEVFHHLSPWDRLAIEIKISEPTFLKWVNEIPSSGDEAACGDGLDDEKVGASHQKSRDLLLFSGNDYLGLSSHPTIGKAAAKAAQEHGMGPRGSALVCGYTNYHRLLESCLADLKKKEDCLLCPTGFAANMALMVALGSVSSLLVAIFSDALNHASIIDGIRLAERQGSAEIFVYRHCDMPHLNELLSSCTLEKKVVVTDSLFSMDGDFAPMAHGTFVCGKNGGGVAEEFNCESDVDICVGTLSKAAGCHGGFIACSKRWKQLILSRGRSFIFSTAMPVPVVAATLASHALNRLTATVYDMTVALAFIAACFLLLTNNYDLKWRRVAIWNRKVDFRALTGIPIGSPIISLIVGSEERALQASRHLLKSGFHVTAIRPPTVPPNSCRLRVTLTSVHTTEDVKKLTVALSDCIGLTQIRVYSSSGYARL